MKAGYFVFEKGNEGAPPYPYQFTTVIDTLPELREHLNARLKDGLMAEDFFIIHGRRKNITAVKVIAEFETVES